MRKKFRKHSKRNLPDKRLIPVVPNRIVGKNFKIIEGYHPISDTDRITYIYKVDEGFKKIEITCVSFDIIFNDKWISIERFDTKHGYLHWHILTEIGIEPKIVVPSNLKKNASLDYIFDWAINHIYNNWYFYRRHFLKSNIKKLKNPIDNY